MDAITTKYVSPTNSRGSRVSATCHAGRVALPWDSALGVSANHAAAALALIRKLGWDTLSYGKWTGGETKAGFVFVAATSGPTIDPEACR